MQNSEFRMQKSKEITEILTEFTDEKKCIGPTGGNIS
jgi:hypothetical protein